MKTTTDKQNSNIKYHDHCRYIKATNAQLVKWSYSRIACVRNSASRERAKRRETSNGLTPLDENLVKSLKYHITCTLDGDCAEGEDILSAIENLVDTAIEGNLTLPRLSKNKRLYLVDYITSHLNK